MDVTRVTVCQIAEPVVGTESENDEDDDADSHQMVMSWTLDDWKVDIFFQLRYTLKVSTAELFLRETPSV